MLSSAREGAGMLEGSARPEASEVSFTKHYTTSMQICSGSDIGFLKSRSVSEPQVQHPILHDVEHRELQLQDFEAVQLGS